ncbi:hypothetical protein OAT67_02210 [Bacteriovoracaceae bacterium]|nr:hypothetical protein [Bacteriovoracaceae bacterium]
MKLEEDKSFYPVLLIVIATYYILFGVMSRSTSTVLIESSIALVFIVLGLLGIYRPLITAMGMIGHGVFDLLHDLALKNPSVPHWWPVFCAVVDLVLGLWIFYSLKNRVLVPIKKERD